MDWRPLVGLAPADAGSLVEAVLARLVMEGVVEARVQAAKG